MTADTQTTARDDQRPDEGPSNPNFIENDLDRVPDKSFRDYDLDDRLVDALEAKGITHPFPIQELTLPVALKGQDIIGQARTGTGKTLGFGLPMIQRLDPDSPHTQALIVTPTRELCIQVYEELRICEAMGFSSTTVYGGVGYDEQIEALDGGVDIVVGTPGRLLDMLGRGHLDLSHVGCVILDEADEMLDMGFLPDVERLLNAANEEGRHTMLFSATMPASVVKLARRYTDQPLFMGADSTDNETAPTVDQYFFQVFRMDKPRVLARILQQPDRGNAMVFTRTKAMADRLVRELEDLGVAAIAIHGDLRQAAREKNLGEFRSAKVDVLCATEVAARGIDVENVTHVVNYDLPDDEKMYLHRIGRTARAGNRGAAVTFAEHSELARLQMIRKAVQQDEDEVPEVFSTSDLLGELFDLPEETPWGHLASSRGGGRGAAGGGRGGSSGGRGGSSGGRRGSDGGRRSPSRSRGSLDNPRGDKHDGDLDSDHDRSRDRVRREGRSLETRVRSRSQDRDQSQGDDGSGRRTRDRSTSRSQDQSSSSGGDERSSRSRSSSRDEGSARGRSRSSSSSSSSSSRSSGRVRARGGKPVGDRADDGSDSGGSSSGRGRGNDDGGSGRSSGNRDRGGRNRSSSRGGGDRSGGKNNGKNSSKNGGKGGGSRRGGGGRTAGNRADAEGSVDLPRKVRTTSAGASARGEGSPRLERRVAVEHLP